MFAGRGRGLGCGVVPFSYEAMSHSKQDLRCIFVVYSVSLAFFFF